MAKRIVTSKKTDIVTGFDITFNVNMLDSIKKEVAPAIEAVVGFPLPDAFWEQDAKDSCGQCVDQLNKLLDEAEEIFIEEASLSRWSGNMIDNSVCGISGDLPQIKGQYTVYMDVRVGVNHKEIMNPKNWDSHANKFFGKHRRFTNPVVYTYNRFRMKPGIDYSVWLDDGSAIAAGIRVHPDWVGFVDRAEERFDNL